MLFWLLLFGWVKFIELKKYSLKGKFMRVKNALIVAFAMALSSSGICQGDATDEKKAEVWNTVQTINSLWTTTENLDSLELFFHPDMIVIFPALKEMNGRDEVMGMYRTYTELAETLSFQAQTPLIQLYNNNTTAVVTYPYELEIRLEDGSSRKATGRDVYTLVYEKGRWIAVAQHYSRYQSK